MNLNSIRTPADGDMDPRAPHNTDVYRRQRYDAERAALGPSAAMRRVGTVRRREHGSPSEPASDVETRTRQQLASRPLAFGPPAPVPRMVNRHDGVRIPLTPWTIFSRVVTVLVPDWLLKAICGARFQVGRVCVLGRTRKLFSTIRADYTHAGQVGAPGLA